MLRPLGIGELGGHTVMSMSELSSAELSSVRCNTRDWSTLSISTLALHVDGKSLGTEMGR